jgi:flagellar biosynthesis anti-sigma factor FlgM
MIGPVTSKVSVSVATAQKDVLKKAEPSLEAHKVVKPEAQSMSLAAALAQKGPPFDAERIAVLKEAIASGVYKIDLTSIANGVIRFGSAK